MSKNRAFPLIHLPGDKSLSHRSFFFSLLNGKENEVHNLNGGADVQSTLKMFELLGGNAKALPTAGSFSLDTSTLSSFESGSPVHVDCGNSGTTMRLGLGLLSFWPRPCQFILSGDESLNKRPMYDIVQKLREMGADITLSKEKYPPVVINSKPLYLNHKNFVLEKPSGQLKSALLLAWAQRRCGTGSEDISELILRGKLGGRDHTERFLQYLGAPLALKGDQLSWPGAGPENHELQAFRFNVPRDISQLSFWLVYLLLRFSKEERVFCFEHIGLNSTRTGLLTLLRDAGFQIDWGVQRENPEPEGTVTLKTGQGLPDKIILSSGIEKLIDEIPILSVLLASLKGVSHISNASELRFKESNRLKEMARLLGERGFNIAYQEDGLLFNDPQNGQSLREYEGKAVGLEHLDFKHDHRLAMSLQVWGLLQLPHLAEDDLYSDQTLKEKYILSKEGARLTSISDPHFLSNVEQIVEFERSLRGGKK